MTEKKMRRHGDDPKRVITVDLRESENTWAHDHLEVYFEGEHVGTIAPHHTQSVRRIAGSRLVSRGATFKAWAARGVDQGDRFDYYAQHRSQAEAIRRLLFRHECRKREAIRKEP